MQGKMMLKEIRLEAVRADFKNAWQGHYYLTIITVTDKIPKQIQSAVEVRPDRYKNGR